MILKSTNTIKYGIPYQGSKNKLIDRIAKFFPNADHFYDLFGGGFSVSHFMMKHRSKSYKQFHYNEIRPGLCELIRDSINGKYNYDVFKPEWIDRERFMREKETNAYIKIVWSFGNNGTTYLFGKEIENEKRSMHNAVIFDIFDSVMIDLFKIDKWPNKLTVQGKRLYLKRICNRRIGFERLQQLERLEQLQQLERLEQLQQLDRLERLEQLELTNKDYQQVEIKENSIIYCDIPYKGTTEYGNKFSHNQFFDWADSQQNPVFISEYNVADDRFKLIKTFRHRSTFSDTKNASGETKECLYVNKEGYEKLLSLGFKPSYS